MLEKYVREYDSNSFGFACCRCTTNDGQTVRCGKKTHYELVIGANEVATPYCKEHLQEMGYLNE